MIRRRAERRLAKQNFTLFFLDKNIEAQYIPNILAICQKFLEATPEDDSTTMRIYRDNKDHRLDQSVEVKK